MAQHVIILANGKRVGLGVFVRAIRYAKDHPDETFAHGLTGWWSVTGREIVSQFYYGMVQDHCNRGLSIPAAVNMRPAYRRFRAGVESVCRGCGASFLRHNPNSDADRYCSALCRVA